MPKSVRKRQNSALGISSPAATTAPALFGAAVELVDKALTWLVARDVEAPVVLFEAKVIVILDEAVAVEKLIESDPDMVTVLVWGVLVPVLLLVCALVSVPVLVLVPVRIDFGLVLVADKDSELLESTQALFASQYVPLGQVAEEMTAS